MDHPSTRSCTATGTLRFGLNYPDNEHLNGSCSSPLNPTLHTQNSRLAPSYDDSQIGLAQWCPLQKGKSLHRVNFSFFTNLQGSGFESRRTSEATPHLFNRNWLSSVSLGDFRSFCEEQQSSWHQVIIKVHFIFLQVVTCFGFEAIH